jgi:nucleotide-binding universal stress UspA family protein
MSLLDRILLPVDFSERSFGAARVIEALADKQNSEIHLLHVTTPLSYEMSALDVGGTVISELNTDRTADLREQLDAFLAEELRPFHVHRHLLEGDPAKRIVEFAHNNQINLIAMPTHGYGLFRRFLLGSVTAKVLHDADCPVWTGVHIEETPPVDKIHFRKVMVAIDLCPGQALKALSWGAQFAERFGAELIVAHAYPSLEGRAGEYFDPNWRNYFTNIAAEEINKMQAKLGMKAEVILEGGDVPHVICNLAQTHQTDALVIGRGSAAGMFGRLRANAYALIRQSPCAVISV